MTYEKWLLLTDREKKKVPDEELPEIPLKMLKNGIVKAVAMRKDGKFGWETTQKVTNGKNTKWFPEYRMKLVEGEEFWYKFDPTSGLYTLNLTGLEPSVEEEPIGKYGMCWMNFMKENYFHLVEEMQFYNRYLTVARSVDRRAREYKEILERDFEKMNPRPDGNSFEENLAWNQAMDFYVDGAVMREVVLVPVTEA